MRDTEAIARLERELKSTRREVGGLVNQFGRLAEGLAFPSMETILTKRFGLEYFVQRASGLPKDSSSEVDLLGYNSETVFAVEVKTLLRPEHVPGLLNVLHDFGAGFPNHSGKCLFGVLAAIEVPFDVAKHVWRHGIYLGRIRDNLFELVEPPAFRPRRFKV